MFFSGPRSERAPDPYYCPDGLGIRLCAEAWRLWQILRSIRAGGLLGLWRALVLLPLGEVRLEREARRCSALRTLSLALSCGRVHQPGLCTPVDIWARCLSWSHGLWMFSSTPGLCPPCARTLSPECLQTLPGVPSGAEPPPWEPLEWILLYESCAYVLIMMGGPWGRALVLQPWLEPLSLSALWGQAAGHAPQASMQGKGETWACSPTF